MPVFTVYIADAGARLATGGTSKTGHMWFSIANGTEPERSYGFAPAPGSHGLPFATGDVYRDDTVTYQDIIYKKSLYISNADYQKVLYFADNPSSEMFFTKNYDGISNNCIDFTWRALNLLKRDAPIYGEEGYAGYTGERWPAWNINDKLRILLNEVKIRNAVDGIPNGIDPINNITSASFFGCFLAGTKILLNNGSLKSIEDIVPGDNVNSYDTKIDEIDSELLPGKVVKIFRNFTRGIIDLRGVHCTPGHVFLTGDGNAGGQKQFATIASILRDDRTIVEQAGTIIRARTGAKLGTDDDAIVAVVYRDHPTADTSGKERGALVRAGIPVPAMILADGKSLAPASSLARHLDAHGVTLLPDGSLRAPDGMHHAACNWPEGATPFDTPEARNWIVAEDDQPYTPSWILDLTDTDDTDGLQVVGDGGALVSAARSLRQQAL